MDDNFVWCALIFATAYILRDTLPSYSELSNMYDRRRVDAINHAVDDNEQTMLAMGKRLEEVQSDVAGHLTRLDDIEAALSYVAIAAGLKMADEITSPTEEKT